MQEMTLFQFLSVVNWYQTLVFIVSEGLYNSSFVCTAQDFRQGGSSIDPNAELLGWTVGDYLVDEINVGATGNLEVTIYLR